GPPRLHRGARGLLPAARDRARRDAPARLHGRALPGRDAVAAHRARDPRPARGSRHRPRPLDAPDDGAASPGRGPPHGALAVSGPTIAVGDRVGADLRPDSARETLRWFWTSVKLGYLTKANGTDPPR